MKKIFNYLLLSIFLLSFTIQILSFLQMTYFIGNKSLTNNTIDLAQEYKINKELVNKRGYKGTYYLEVQNQQLPVLKIAAIKKLTNAYFSKSDNIAEIQVEKTFKSYDELLVVLNSEIKNDWNNIVSNIVERYYYKSSYIIKKAINTAEYQSKVSELKANILLFYNFITFFWGKSSLNQVLKVIKIVSHIKSNGGKALGQATEKQEVSLLPEVMNYFYFPEDMKNIWKLGEFTTSHFLHPLIHELGHIFFFYLTKKGLDSNDKNEYLIKFLKSKIINRYQLKSEISDNIIYYTFSNSTYGASQNAELMAEAFAYWLLTPVTLRTKAWDFLNEFFLSYLPTLQKDWNYYKVLLTSSSITTVIILALWTFNDYGAVIINKLKNKSD